MEWIETWAGKNKAKTCCFRQTLLPPVNKFEVNYVVEAADLRIAIHDSPTDHRQSSLSPYNQNSNRNHKQAWGSTQQHHRRRRPLTFSLAKVIDKEGPRLRLRHLGTDDRNDIWLMLDSDCLRLYPSGKELSVPFGFMSSHSVWSRILSRVETDELIAPPEWFPPHPKDPGSNQFKIGEKLEAVDRRNAQLICPATIGDIKADFVLVKFDGWSGNFDYWAAYNSQDLFPVGWCRRARYKLQLPGPGYMLRLSEADGGGASHKAVKRRQTNVYTPIASVMAVKSTGRRKSAKPGRSKSMLGTVTVVTATGANSNNSTAKSGISSPDSESTHICCAVEDDREQQVMQRRTFKELVTMRDKRTKKTRKKKRRSLLEMRSDKSSVTVPDDDEDFEVKDDEHAGKEEDTKEEFDDVKKDERLERGGVTFANLSVKLEHNIEDYVSGDSNPDSFVRMKLKKDYSDNSYKIMRHISPPPSRPNYSTAASTTSAVAVSPTKSSSSSTPDDPPHLDSSPTTGPPPMPSSFSQPGSPANSSTGGGCCSRLPLSDTSGVSTSSYTGASHQQQQPGSPLTLAAQPPPHSLLRLPVPVDTNDEGYVQISSDPSNWSVEDVTTYISSKNPSLEPAMQEFRNHEIDGQALLLLTMNTLRQYMKVKLGPAIKIENIIRNVQQGKL